MNSPKPLNRGCHILGMHPSRAIAEKGYNVKAVEPSDVMMIQGEKHPNVDWIKSLAENIPLDSNSADAAISILSIHHFSNTTKSIEEMARVTGKGTILFFTFDPRQVRRPWLAEYFPYLWDETFRYFPPIDEVAEGVRSATGGEISIHTFELPHDLQDYFAAVGWRRPEIYLDPIVRSCMSGFAMADQGFVEIGVDTLRADLENGEWDKKYGWLRGQDSADVAYRFILSKPMA